jgi:hypothetical protein
MIIVELAAASDTCKYCALEEENVKEILHDVLNELYSKSKEETPKS